MAHSGPGCPGPRPLRIAVAPGWSGPVMYYKVVLGIMKCSITKAEEKKYQPANKKP